MYRTSTSSRPLQFSFWPQRSQKSWYSCSMVIPHRGHFGNLAPPPIRAYNFHFPRPCGFIIKIFYIEQKCTISHTISQNHFRRNFSKRGSRGAHLGRTNAPGGCPGPRTLRGMHAISHEKCIRIKRTRMQKRPKIQNCEKT